MNTNAGKNKKKIKKRKEKKNTCKVVSPESKR